MALCASSPHPPRRSSAFLHGLGRKRKSDLMPHESLVPGNSPMTASGALQPLATTFPLVSGSLYRVLEIAAISVAGVTIW